MKSATLRATILAAGLLLAGAASGAGAGDAAPAAAPANTQSAAVAIAQTPGEDAEDGKQALSTLGALALGIIGLLWARRHIAEL
jgi:hypothetical protein